MTTYAPGENATLTVEWRSYAGGPLVPVTGVTITVTNAVTAAVVLATTSAGVTNPGIGLNAYVWSVPGVTPDGTYVVQWSGVDVDGDTVTATEYVEVDAPADVYTDLATVRAMLSMTAVDAQADMLINKAIRTASRSIDKRCGRRFYKDTAATAKTFGPIGRLFYDGIRYSLVVDDIASATGLLVGGVSWTQYGPDNAGTAVPITYLNGSDYSVNPFTDTVTVTAYWGWPAVPDEIEQATALLAARLYRRKDSPQGVVGSDQWGVTRVARFDPDVEGLINPYRIGGFA